jgi:hypothetical protein
LSKHPIIVLEGGDGCGKTMLAEKICDYVGGHYVHLTYRFKDRMHCYHGAALKMALLRAEHQPVVVDRWWPSELVYAAAYRGGSKWPLMYRHLHRVGLRHGVSYVFCIPRDRENYLSHFNRLKGEREEMYDSGMDRVYEEFVGIRQSMLDDRVPAVYDYDMFQDGHDMDAVVQGVLESAEDERALLPDYAKDLSFHNLSGSPARAKILVVDDGQEFSGKSHGPFTDYDSRYGLRWSRALDKTGTSEVDLCYVSLGHPDEETTVRAIREISRTTRVVALGEAADEALTKLGVMTSDVLLHPRQWGRDDRNDHMHLWKAF